MKSLLAEGRGEEGGGKGHMQVLLPAFQSVVKALLTSGRSSSRRESQVPRPLESEKTFLLVQVKLSASRKWKLSRLCFVARGVVRLSFPFLSLPSFIFPSLSFFSSSSYPSFGFRSRWCLVFNTDWTRYFCYFIGRCQNADPREQFGNRDDARKIDDLRDELQADDADQSYV